VRKVVQLLHFYHVRKRAQSIPRLVVPLPVVNDAGKKEGDVSGGLTVYCMKRAAISYGDRETVSVKKTAMQNFARSSGSTGLIALGA